MEQLLEAIYLHVLDPTTLLGAVNWAVAFFAAAAAVAAVIRRAARRMEPRLSDVTGLHFVSALGQVLAFVLAAIAYAHVVPRLRALGTALLAGVSIVSIVVGLAAQSTLANLIAGFSLVLYRPVRVGDVVQLNSPRGLVTATVERVTLGYTVLRDPERSEIIVPNSVMVSSVVIRLGSGRG